jgi:ribose 5-phosphate isomerase A
MKWEKAPNDDLWTGQISNRAAKAELGRRIADNVKDGQVIGAGSGSTSYLAIEAIADRVRREKLNVAAICTSAEMQLACAALELPVTTLFQHRPDWCFDGADEVDPDHNLIKGRGGAMYLEKILIDSTLERFILVDESKLVKRLGEKFAVPVEVTPVALRLVERELAGIGATEIKLRSAVKKDGPVITENGNFILDVRFRDIRNSLEKEIKGITGVVESGLFIGRAVQILVAQ